MLLLGSAAITGAGTSGRTLSASAVVSAPVIRIAAPFDGRIVQAPPARGAAVRPGDTLVRVAATPHADGRLADLQAQLAAAKHQRAAAATQAKALTDARGQMKARMKRYREGAIARLAAQLKEAEALHNIYRARLAQSGDALDRQVQLKTKGYASQAKFDAASASATIARNDVPASAARMERIRVELDSARKGIFIDGRDDVPYSQQRDDEIMLRLVELDARQASLEATIDDLEGRIAAEAKRVAAGDVFKQTASIAGLVWEAAGTEGATVRAGDPLVNLLDCSRPYLEVALDGNAGDGIRAGDRARVRMPDTGSTIDATVRGLRGTAGNGRTTVLVDLPTATDAASIQAYCNVGRVAEVTFGGPAPRKRDRTANADSIPQTGRDHARQQLHTARN